MLARVDAGQLDPDSLRLAAFLGDPGARAALHDSLDPAWTPFCRSHDELRVWSSQLPAFGRAALERAAWAGTRAWLDLYLGVCVPRLRSSWRDPARSELLTVSAALERCALSPDDETRTAVGRAVHALARWPDDAHLRDARARLRRLAQALAARRVSKQSTDCAVEAVVRADTLPVTASRNGAVRAGVGEGRIRNVIRSALLPWLLG